MKIVPKTLLSEEPQLMNRVMGFGRHVENQPEENRSADDDNYLPDETTYSRQTLEILLRCSSMALSFRLGKLLSAGRKSAGL